MSQKLFPFIKIGGKRERCTHILSCTPYMELVILFSAANRTLIRTRFKLPETHFSSHIMLFVVMRSQIMFKGKVFVCNIFEMATSL